MCYFKCCLPPIVINAATRTASQKKANSFDVPLTDSLMERCVPVLSASINLCASIKQ